MTSKPKANKPDEALPSTEAKDSPATTQAQTSASAFASSGFGAFASSSSSGFGSLSSGNKLSSFASPEPETKPADEKPASKSTFGGALGQASAFGGRGGSAFGGGSGSAFGSSSGFGGGFASSGSAFGSGFGGSGGVKLSSFASPVAGDLSGIKKPARAFGAPADADEEGSEQEEGDEEDGAKVKSPNVGDDSEKRDERFYQQDG